MNAGLSGVTTFDTSALFIRFSSALIQVLWGRGIYNPSDVKVVLCILLSLLAPRHAPDSVITYSSSSTSIIVKWVQLPDNDFRGQPVGHSIIYYQVT